MLGHLTMLAERFEKLTLRERLMVLGASAVIGYAIMDAAMLSPLALRQRRAGQDLSQRQADLKALGDSLQAVQKTIAGSPDSSNRKRLAEINARLASLNSQLEEQSKLLISPERMRGLLEKVLASRARVQLVDLKTLPLTDIMLAPSSAPKPPSPSAPKTVAGAQQAASQSQKSASSQTAPDPADMSTQIYRHGMEITLRGSYLDLLEYLRDIERLPDRIYWGDLHLVVKDHPLAMLKLTVYTISLDRVWLLV